jgi:tRNA modification GTPase
MLLRETIAYGARPARAGEFTERAYLNDKIDLTQAESIADIINASSDQAARSAVRSLQGDFSNKINRLIEELISTRVYIEAAIDFPEEEIDFLAEKEIQDKFLSIHESIKKVFDSCKQGAILREGITLVIAGKPNAGKSSLLNALSGKESAIVTDIAGTTRDTLKEYIQINGVPLHIIDTAGLRISDDVIENEGVKRAFDAIKNADHILLVADITDPSNENMHALEPKYFKLLPKNIPITYIHNKVDLLKRKNNTKKDIYISAKHGTGISELKTHILESVGYNNVPEGVFTARTRHINALKLCLNHLDIAKCHLQNKTGELLAEELKLAQNSLSDITGEYKADDLLGEIFSSFCIGK